MLCYAIATSYHVHGASGKAALRWSSSGRPPSRTSKPTASPPSGVSRPAKNLHANFVQIVVGATPRKPPRKLHSNKGSPGPRKTSMQALCNSGPRKTSMQFKFVIMVGASLVKKNTEWSPVSVFGAFYYNGDTNRYCMNI